MRRASPRARSSRTWRAGTCCYGGGPIAPQNLAVVLVVSPSSYKEPDAAVAPRTTYPNGAADFYQQDGTYGVHTTEEADNDAQDIEALLAEFRTADRADRLTRRGWCVENMRDRPGRAWRWSAASFARCSSYH